MVAPVEPVAREYLRKAGLPFDPAKTYVLKDPQKPHWGWQGTLEYLMEYWFGEDSAEFSAANLLRLIQGLRNLLAHQGPPENVMILTTQLMITLEYAKNTRLFTRRGAPSGPRDFRDDQEFLDTIIDLIKLVDSQGLRPTQERVAEFLMTKIEDRRQGTMSVANTDGSVESTTRFIRTHLKDRYTWSELVKKARTTP